MKEIVDPLLHKLDLMLARHEDAAALDGKEGYCGACSTQTLREEILKWGEEIAKTYVKHKAPWMMNVIEKRFAHKPRPYRRKKKSTGCQMCDDGVPFELGHPNFHRVDSVTVVSCSAGAKSREGT